MKSNENELSLAVQRVVHANRPMIAEIQQSLRGRYWTMIDYDSLFNKYCLFVIIRWVRNWIHGHGNDIGLELMAQKLDSLPNAHEYTTEEIMKFRIDIHFLFEEVGTNCVEMGVGD